MSPLAEPFPDLAQRERGDCAIGFLASRKGVAERGLVEMALDLCRQFDHRGAPGHGAGMLLDIPWAILLERFPEHARVVAQRDAALGNIFLPFDGPCRRRCVEAVEDLASLGGADVLGWADVPFNVEALPAGSPARRTAPVVRQALFRRPAGSSEEAWFLTRFLLRLALDEQLFDLSHGEFAVSSLSNRTVVYRGLAELSRLAELYPDLRSEAFASRFVLFHSRYSTNTTTSWRRAQPFWGLAHNGEIATIRGNVAWMHAIGRDLVARIVERHPRLRHLAARVGSVVCAGGSDSANLDDMMIALVAGGLGMPQALLALLPEAPSMARGEPHLAAFHEAMAVFLGACDGPAAIVACDGDEAVAHLDRNGLRPLWVAASRDYALAASELTGTLDLGPLELQRLLGPGDTAMVRLSSGEVLLTEEVHRLLARQRFPQPAAGVPGGCLAPAAPPPPEELARLATAFGMTRDDLEVVVEPLARDGKLAVGSMGDDTPAAALLDRLPRRLDDYFKLRFAQETSPPIDPIRDAWVFETGVALGCRAGLWGEAGGPWFEFPHRLLSTGERDWLLARERVVRLDATFPVAGDGERDAAALESALDAAVAAGLAALGAASVLVVSDRASLRRPRAAADAAPRLAPPPRDRRRRRPPPGRPGRRRRRLGRPPLRAARRARRRRRRALARLRRGRRTRGDLSRRGARGLPRGDVDDRRDARLGLLRRAARRGDRARRGARAARLPRRARALRRHGRRAARPRVARLPPRRVPGRRAARRRRRVQVQEGGPSAPPLARGGQGAAGGLRLRPAAAAAQRRGDRRGLPPARRARRRARADPAARPAPPRRDRRAAAAARRGRARGGDRLALLHPGHERGRALRAGAPRGRARHEPALALVPPAPPARRPAAAARPRPLRQQRRGRLRQDADRRTRGQPLDPVRGRPLHRHAGDRGARRGGRGEVRAGREAGQGRAASGRQGLAARRRAARLRGGLRAGVAAGQPQPLLDRGRQADARELASAQPGRRLRAQAGGDRRGRDGGARRRPRRRQPDPPLGRLRRHRRRQAGRPEARRRAGGGAAADRARRAGRGGGARAGRALGRRRRADRRAGARS